MRRARKLKVWTPQVQNPKIESLLTLAIRAGAEIMAIYAEEFDVEIKPDNSPVTQADTRAEAIILEGLAAIAPDVPVVAEEAVAAGTIPPPSRVFFLVDPLDGSKEFISRNGEFTVNIGLIEDGEPVLGIVFAPALGKIWWGGKDTGAYFATVENGQISTARALAVSKPSVDGFRVVGSRSHATPELDTFLSTIAVADFVAAGSSLKFCLLAEGQADLYPRFGRTMEWDTAAGDAILRAAGGSVVTLDEKPLRYGKRDQPDDCDFANSFFIARTGRNAATA